jgi:hypothetical protein
MKGGAVNSAVRWYDGFNTRYAGDYTIEFPLRRVYLKNWSTRPRESGEDEQKGIRGEIIQTRLMKPRNGSY